MQHTVSPIGIVHSCFKEKFAIPRQPQLAPAARGILELLPPFNDPAAVAGLDRDTLLGPARASGGSRQYQGIERRKIESFVGYLRSDKD